MPTPRSIEVSTVIQDIRLYKEDLPKLFAIIDRVGGNRENIKINTAENDFTDGQDFLEHHHANKIRELTLIRYGQPSAMIFINKDRSVRITGKRDNLLSQALYQDLITYFEDRQQPFLLRIHPIGGFAFAALGGVFWTLETMAKTLAARHMYLSFQLLSAVTFLYYIDMIPSMFGLAPIYPTRSRPSWLMTMVAPTLVTVIGGLIVAAIIALWNKATGG